MKVPTAGWLTSPNSSLIIPFPSYSNLFFLSHSSGLMASGDANKLMARAEELFEREEPGFVDALREVEDLSLLSSFSDRWKHDARSWARNQICSYLQRPLDRPGHQTVVKRLFKQAEEQQDDELMAAFLVAFDRLVRRERKKLYRWNWRTGESWTEDRLISPRNTAPLSRIETYINPRTGREVNAVARLPRNPRLFSYHTRYHLRRRAWRYFRRMGFTSGAAYPAAIAQALVQFQDADLATGEDILENWGLMQACFFHNPALHFGAARIQVHVGYTVSDLSAAPRFPELWQSEASAEALLRILSQAQARLLRLWSIELLRAHHRESLATISIDALFELLNHTDDEVQQFGAELLENHRELDRLPVEMWLRLLNVQNPTVLEAICQVMRKHVSVDRLTLEECIQLACVEATSVARLGFEFLRQRQVEDADQRQLLRKLAGARCEAIGGELAAWALAIVGADDDDLYDTDSVCYFFDSLLASIRDAAWQWLVTPSRGYQDTVLWSRILETPFDDLRLRVIDELEKRTRLPGVEQDDLASVWCSVLLGVHRGGRQKAKAVRQIGEALMENTDRADDLLPILAVAVRSIRRPEFRAGLAAIVVTLLQRPELVAVVQRYLPELVFAAKSEEATG